MESSVPEGQSDSQQSPQALTSQLHMADTPFRAWGAVALLGAQSARHRAEGRRVATELADSMPTADGLQHADIAAYALLDRAGFLSPQQRDRLVSAIPPPNLNRDRRARFYSSSCYVYLLARGLGSRIQRAEDFVRVIDEEMESATNHGFPDLVDIAMLFAARLELRSVVSVPDETLRTLRGRVAGAVPSVEGAVALRWLLEVHESAWPEGIEGESLRKAMTSFVNDSRLDQIGAQARAPVAAMTLEVDLRRDPEFRLVTRSDERAAVAAKLGRRRWFEGTAYVAIIFLAVSVPVLVAVREGRMPLVVGYVAAIALGVPAALFAIFIVAGREYDRRLLGTGFTAGLIYYCVATFVAWVQPRGWLEHVAGEGVVLTLLGTFITSLWAGATSKSG